MTKTAGKMSKPLIALCIAVAAALLIFFGYPLIVCAINYPGLVKEKNRVAEKVEKLGGEVYSSEVKTSTEMFYSGSLRINYVTEYVIVFKSDKTYDELNELIRDQFVCELDRFGRDGFGDRDMLPRKLPEETEGYYTVYFIPRPTIGETGATMLHTYIYADEDDREYINEQLSYGY